MIREDLKVLLISPLPPPAGGIASWTTQYLNWSEKNALEVEIVNTAVIGIRAQKINNRTRILDEIRRTYNILDDLKVKIDRLKPQIVHLNTPCGKLGIIRDYLCARRAKKSGVKLFVHYRCNIRDQVKKSKVSNFFLRKLAKIADVNLVLNDSSREYLENLANCYGIKIANFIDENSIIMDSKRIDVRIRTVSFIGHVQKSKGVIEIIHAAKMLPEITFKLAGPVAAEIKEMDTPENLQFLDAILKNEVRDLLMESDVFLLPSYTEGFSNALLEAMAMGLPIITTPVGANEDMIEHMGGLIVEVGDSTNIIKAITELSDYDKRLNMSQWNLDKVKNFYTTDKVMHELVFHYLKSLTNR
ncbi:MAG: glycosyltransferase family 4 protein [Erysipelotrichaceae bacterium]|nr:glycosyltransferase family 4 protein [Erysipelotrichaceae bacterium]